MMVIATRVVLMKQDGIIIDAYWKWGGGIDWLRMVLTSGQGVVISGRALLYGLCYELWE